MAQHRRRRVRQRRLVPLAVLCGMVLAACGGVGGNTTTKFFWVPEMHVFLGMSGPAGAISVLSSTFPFHTRVVRKAPGRKHCSSTTTIGSQAQPSLRKYAGQHVALSVYGNSKRVRALCKFLKRPITTFPP
jgi:hypothetical protein